MLPFSPPTIADLTDRLLKRSDVADFVESGEVEPYEVLTGFRTDPRTAYNDALAPLKLLGEKKIPSKPRLEGSFMDLLDLARHRSLTGRYRGFHFRIASGKPALRVMARAAWLSLRLANGPA